MLPGYRLVVVAQSLSLPLECQFLFHGIGHPEVASIQRKVEDQRIDGCGMPFAPYIESDGAASVVEIFGVNGIQVSSVGTAKGLSDEEPELLLDVAPERVGNLSRAKASGTEHQSTAHW
jgi:hypothetical protein